MFVKAGIYHDVMHKFDETKHSMNPNGWVGGQVKGDVTKVAIPLLYHLSITTPAYSLCNQGIYLGSLEDLLRGNVLILCGAFVVSLDPANIFASSKAPSLYALQNHCESISTTMYGGKLAYTKPDGPLLG